MLKYALTLSKCTDTRAEGIKTFLSAISLIKEFKEVLTDTDLPFNMLLYMMMEAPLLDNGSGDVDLTTVNALIEKETEFTKYCHNQIKKQSLLLVCRASVYDGSDLASFLNLLCD